MKMYQFLSLVDGTSLENIKPDSVTFVTPSGKFDVVVADSGVLAVLTRLNTGQLSEQEVMHLALLEGGFTSITNTLSCLNLLYKKKVLLRRLWHNNSPILTIFPLASACTLSVVEIQEDDDFVSSRFAYCRHDQNTTLLESPTSHESIIFHSWPAVALWSELRSPTSVKTLALSFPDLPIQLIRAIITNLFSANFILRSSPSCETLEETPPLCLWEFHDLLFHARSRLGRHSNPYGGTYRFRNKIEPLPAAKPQLGLPTILFDKIDRSQIDSQNIPFIRVLDNRKSIRNHGDEVLSKEELGMFLFLTARTKEIFDTPYGQLSRRPYPSGGASYELEIYVLVNRCTSIPKALYHYCPLKHALFRVADQNEYTHALLESAWHTVQRESRPHVLLIITSRIGRVSWKYQSIAYSLILKHVGVLVQTMYLVATQLGLAPCALGGGDSDLFSLASGINYYEETSVCEFILGKPTPSIDS